MTSSAPRLTTEVCACCGAADVWLGDDGLLRCACCGRREDPIKQVMGEERHRGRPDWPPDYRR